MSSFGKFALGAFVGGALGAVIGLLLAPRSGEETRSLIREELEKNYQHSLDEVKDRTETLKEKARQLSADLEATGRQVVSRLSEKRESTES